MKKVVFILGFIIASILNVSCTDNALKELEDHEKQIKLIENEEIGDEGDDDPIKTGD
ncbi:conserved hypothetical protein [Tenacibaculum sp. 190524A02b]|uniref:Lipoprotein n=1 Tax=Tenacibaculum vairaonense TaxID=3137860 RepID=A0ABM9PS30_9FLAO